MWSVMGIQADNRVNLIGMVVLLYILAMLLLWAVVDRRKRPTARPAPPVKEELIVWSHAALDRRRQLFNSFENSVDDGCVSAMQNLLQRQPGVPQCIEPTHVDMFVGATIVSLLRQLAAETDTDDANEEFIRDCRTWVAVAKKQCDVSPGSPTLARWAVRHYETLLHSYCRMAERYQAMLVYEAQVPQTTWEMLDKLQEEMQRLRDAVQQQAAHD